MMTRRTRTLLRPEGPTERQICTARASRGSERTVGGVLNNHWRHCEGKGRVRRTKRRIVRSADIALQGTHVMSSSVPTPEDKKRGHAHMLGV